MTFRNVLQLLFSPQILRKEALKEYSAVRAENILEIEKMIKGKRESLFLELLWILTLAILGFITAQAINLIFVIPSSIIHTTRIISVSIFAFATLSRLGETPTFDGNSLIEKTNKLLFKVLYGIGFLLTITALSLDVT